MTFQQLPAPIKWTSIAYVCTSLIYTCIGSYLDSKEYLMKFRNNELYHFDSFNRETIKSEWDAVKYGAQLKFWRRFFHSLIWPYSLVSNIIPGLVLYLNPIDKQNKQNKEN